MGAYRSKPITDKVTEIGQNSQLSYAATHMQGWRHTMEDTHIAEINLGENRYLFGVFDGHGVSLFVKKHYVEELLKNHNYKEGKYQLALEQNMVQMDKMLLMKKGQKELAKFREGQEVNGQKIELKGPSIAGCTANVSLMVDGILYCANTGDSRTLLCNQGKPLPMSVDHKPEDELESDRIMNAGGFIEEGRVDGNLNLSRCIGDFEYKKDPEFKLDEQKIISHPDIQIRKLTKKDEFMILGCDGIWETLDNQEIIDFIKDGLAKKQPLQEINENLLDKLIAQDTTTGLGLDNMTCIIIDLKKLKLANNYKSILPKPPLKKPNKFKEKRESNKQKRQVRQYFCRIKSWNKKYQKSLKETDPGFIEKIRQKTKRAAEIKRDLLILRRNKVARGKLNKRVFKARKIRKLNKKLFKTRKIGIFARLCMWKNNKIMRKVQRKQFKLISGSLNINLTEKLWKYT